MASIRATRSTRFRLPPLFTASLLTAALLAPSDAFGEVRLFLPGNNVYTTKRALAVMGLVKTTPGPNEQAFVTVMVNSRQSYRFKVRDSYFFAGEVDLDDGANTILVEKTSIQVYAGDAAEAPGGYKKVYGHAMPEDTCDECHRAEYDAKGKLSLKLIEPPENLCNWCHYQTVNPRKQNVPLSIHEPAKSGSCLSCHLPHTGDRRALLKDEPGKLCASCHTKLRDDLKSKPYIHGPLNVGGCDLCHLAHTSPNPNLLKQSERDICLPCHGSMEGSAGKEGAVSPHPGIREGRCHDCHTPHASSNPKLMKKILNNLCIECHPEKSRNFHEEKGFSIYLCERCHNIHSPDTSHLVINESKSLCLQCHDKLGKGEFVHQVVAEKTCFDCHSFHESSFGGSQREVCARCHPENQAFADGHPVGMTKDVRCTGCHSPHRSTSKNLTYPIQHEPFSAKECDACHKEMLSPVEDKDFARDTLCFNCHPEKTPLPQDQGEVIIHKPFINEKCSACHLPHNSDYPYLLSLETVDLCGRCHSFAKKLKSFAPVSIHPFIKEGRCGSCHDIHLGKNAKLLKKPLPVLCLECHRRIVESEKGEPYPIIHSPMQKGDCGQCHIAHSSRNPSLLREKETAICEQCHERFYKILKNPVYRVTHAPIAKGECGKCHELHGSERGKLLKSESNALCVPCHSRIERGLHHHYASDFETYDYASLAGRKVGCLECHKSHYSPNKALVIKNDVPLCKECHTR